MEFKTYEESRLKDLGELVNDVVKHWEIDPWYPSMEQLKEVYENNENFTPETRHFVYDGDKLVAFLSSALEDEVEGVQWGSIHMPFIRKGYEKVEEELFEKTISLLKSKGAQAIRASSRPDHGYIPELLEKWGFEKKDGQGHRAILFTDKFVKKEYTKPDYVYEVDLKEEKGLEKFKKAYLKARTEVTEENFAQTMKLFEERDLTISCIILKKDKLLSYGLFYKSDNPKRSFLSSIPIFEKGHEHVINDVLAYTFNKAKELGIEEIYHNIVELDYEKLYKKLGIEFSPSFRYELHFD